MKWLEIITLRSPEHINRQFLDDHLKGVRESELQTDAQNHLVEVRVYHHSVVETDLSIHIYWESEHGGQDKSALGLRFSSALKPLGLLNYSVWVETTALEFPLNHGSASSGDVVASVGSMAGKEHRNGRMGG